MSTRLLSSEDMYDVYGLEHVLGPVVARTALDQEDADFIAFRLGEIKDAYVHACKSRIRAEAKFLGIELEDASFATILTRMREHLGKAVQNSMMANAANMQRGGNFNLMSEILKAHQAAGNPLTGVDVTKYGVKQQAPAPRPDVDPNWFMKGNAGRVTEDPKWAEITQAYLAVENAGTNSAIIGAIDRLNQLQHNSFHVLIDLQTGRMLTDFSNQTDDREARKRLQDILNIKLEAKGPAVFADRMSKEVRTLLKKYRGATKV